MFKKTKNSLAICLSVAMLATMITIPSVASAVTSTPLAGADRYQTALKIVENGWKTSKNVIIARGDVMADALAAAPLAYAKDKAPILLTKSDKIPTGVLEELEKLGVKNVYIVGGTGAVTKAVADELDIDYAVTRIEGKDRYETSYNIAQALPTAKEVAIVNGYAYVDALSISSIAANKGMPIVLVNNKKLSTQVISYIANKTVYAVGGTGVLSNEVVGSATRLDGANRYETNASILKKFKQDYSNIYLAMGTDEHMIDALSGSALAAKGNNPMVLVNGQNQINKNQEIVVEANITANSRIFTLGETVTNVAVNAIEALKAPVTPVKLTNVSVTSATTVTFNSDATPTTVTWNGGAAIVASYDATTKLATITVPSITKTVNTLVVNAAGYSEANITVTITKGVDNLKLIATASELADAIDTQAVGQSWIIKAGTYDLNALELAKYSAWKDSGSSSEGWYFPIHETITITGEGNPTITSSVTTPNGAWATQSFISVWADDVKISGITINAKNYAGKSIEVMGKNFKLHNSIIAPRLDATSDWSGMVMFGPINSGKDIGNAEIINTKIYKSGISCSTYYVSEGSLKIENVLVDKHGMTRAGAYWDDFKNLSIPGNVRINATTGNKVIIDNNITNIQEEVFNYVPSGTTVELAAGIYELSSQLAITRPVTIIGSDQGIVTLKATGTWSTVNGYKHLLEISAGTSEKPVTISNITIDANLISHAVNAYNNAYGILNNVTIKNGKGAGLTVNGSTIKATNLNTSGNAWGAVNVDPGSGVTVPSIFNLDGNGVLGENIQIWSDGEHVNSTATVSVSAGGYTLTHYDPSYAGAIAQSGTIWSKE